MSTALSRLLAAAQARKLTCITAWDFPTALLAETAGLDLILVGDSLGVTTLGYRDTKGVTLDEMVHHTRAVTRATKQIFVLADLPLGSYEKSHEHAIASAIRLVKEGGADGVKLEGGQDMCPTVAAISKVGIPVIGHIGLTMQRANWEKSNSVGVVRDAKCVQEAGAVAVVVEDVSDGTARETTEAVQIPTIGIGSGPHCNGQLVLQSEILGYQTSLFPQWHKRYINIGELSVQAMKDFHKEVQDAKFPPNEQSTGVA